jgi:hypothetical protein
VNVADDTDWPSRAEVIEDLVERMVDDPTQTAPMNPTVAQGPIGNDGQWGESFAQPTLMRDAVQTLDVDAASAGRDVALARCSRRHGCCSPPLSLRRQVPHGDRLAH